MENEKTLTPSACIFKQNTMLIDTHTHLYDNAFDTDREEVIRRALRSGVERMYMPNCDASTITAMLEVEAAFPDHCFAMMGLHPCSVNQHVQEELALVREWLERRPFKAVGEIGLDYHWDKTYVPQQQEALRIQFEWALEFKLPVVLHARESTKDILDIVTEYAPRGLRGVFHCFSGSYETARQIMNLGFFLGIGGVLTYKNAGLADVVQKIPLDFLVLETDAPYLTPVPYRGKRNESSYVSLVAQRLAEIRGCGTAEIRQVTGENALRLFQENILYSPL